MNKLKIEELKNNLYLGDYGEYITNYSDGYISDILHEIADNNIDCYNYDLLQWCANNLNNIYWCDQAKDELGADDLISMLQGGQYLQIMNELYENQEDILKYYVYNYINETYEIKEITEEQNDEIDILNYSNFEKLEEINDEIENIINK